MIRHTQRHLAAGLCLALFAARSHTAVHAQATPAGLWKSLDDESKKEKSLIRSARAGSAPLMEMDEALF